MHFIQQGIEALLHLAFPHLCEGCGNDMNDREALICIRCHARLPRTNFQQYPSNPVERLFWGRLPLLHATAQYYFSKASMMQQLMHEIKYRGNRELAIYLGTLIGTQLASSPNFSSVDALVPLPLFAQRERQRGYNQASLLCKGIAAVMQVPVGEQWIIRTSASESQTSKGRVDRWLNMEGRFSLQDPEAAKNKHLLLVDDVITTGATLEACGRELLKAPGARLSVAALCVAGSS